MLTYTLCALAVIGASVFYLFFYRGWRREKRLQKPFPEYWQEKLQAQVPVYSKLPSELRHQLEQHVQLFLAEKSFYGCDGFEVDDTVRLTIAGHACLLIVARNFSDFDDVSSILVYPDAYHVREVESDGIVVSESNQIRAGEASSRGQVVLAWAECEEGAVNPAGHHNVILHEFAHQLDYLDGTADGAPPLSGEQARHWQQTMTRAYEHLRQSLRHHQKPWLDPYGATEPAEFFAVLTEAFFQQPGHLQEEQPEVFEALRGFYRFDPINLLSHPNDPDKHAAPPR
ncbi:M90 family metallopeptidase [Marinobacter sp. ATCH36]|uniref:M90 family metallopeptidase n=1 Tax=Marinobacter sp. ATCH36 TaxID=2945106 RepID=UPI00201FC7FB|nr:M90 family metallopeptidase [Marinobacter sp. ATCH36]MCL7944200.1 zinc-dependent peptidase [Marinobacter sp. ATCH36]